MIPIGHEEKEGRKDFEATGRHSIYCIALDIKNHVKSDKTQES